MEPEPAGSEEPGAANGQKSGAKASGTTRAATGTAGAPTGTAGETIGTTAAANLETPGREGAEGRKEKAEGAEGAGEWNGMEYVIWAKGPALEPVRSFSANRRRREKRNKIEQEESIQQN